MRRAVALVTACIAAQSPAALADDAGAPPDEQEAIRHLNLGIAAYKRGHDDEALAELAETERLAPDRVNTHRWFAIVLARRGDCAAALRHVDAFMAQASESDRRLPEILELRERCVGAGTLVVRSTPAGASISLDGGQLPGATTPYRALGVRGGSHVVSVDLRGYQPAARTIAMPAAGELVLDLDLAPTPVRHTRSQRWWWVAGGAVAAVAVAGIVIVATRDGVNTLPPIVCDAGACH